MSAARESVSDSASFDSYIDAIPLPFLHRWGKNFRYELDSKADPVLITQGYASRDGTRAIQHGTITEISSVTKMLTAATLLLLMDRQAMDSSLPRHFTDGLSTPISSFLPLLDALYPEAPFFQHLRHVPHFTRITLSHLLNHRHGIGRYDTAQILHRLRLHPSTALRCIDFLNSTLPKLYGTFGKFEYDSLGFDLLGVLIEAIASDQLRKSVSYDQAVRRFILDPLSLTHTYMIDESPPPSASCSEPLFYHSRFVCAELPKELEGVYRLPFSRAATSIRSNTEDLCRFGRAYLSGSLFQSHTIQTLVRDTLRTMRDFPERSSYELGVRYLGAHRRAPNGFFGHMGCNYASGALLAFNPEDDSCFSGFLVGDTFRPHLAALSLFKQDRISFPSVGEEETTMAAVMRSQTFQNLQHKPLASFHILRPFFDPPREGRGTDSFRRAG